MANIGTESCSVRAAWVLPMIDRFEDSHPIGRAIGTRTTSGAIRRGVDRERVIGIDNGALRIGQMAKHGWGRSGITYGPYCRQNGLAFGTMLLNGHNTSQAEPLPEAVSARIRRWLLGSETETPLARMRRLRRARQLRYLPRRLWQWIRTGTRLYRITPIDENLSIGWFPAEAPDSPVEGSSSFVMHALGPECGELWARVGATCQPVVRGVQNVPIYYLVVLRESGAAYYAASIPRTPGFGTLPTLRLLAIDPFTTEPTVFAGVHQSVLGQIGFRAETRVYHTQVTALPEFGTWYGSAYAADRLTGDTPLHLSNAEVGGQWLVHEGALMRTEEGVVGLEQINHATLQPPSHAGFIHAVIKTGERPVEGVALVWREKDEENFWCIEVSSRHSRLALKQNGVWCMFPSTRAHSLVRNTSNVLQIADDGEQIAIYLNGELVYGTRFTDSRLREAKGVGIRTSGQQREAAVHSFEAHPRFIPIPATLDPGQPGLEDGVRIEAKDDFAGSVAELEGRKTLLGNRQWRKEIGRGSFELNGKDAARVVATAQRPCPGRTAYTIDWLNPHFADVAARITPPRKGSGAPEKGRGGLIFWQDERNYITLSVFLDDWYGTSIAAFFYVDGYEELYDALWTNVGRRIYWGTPYDFRVVFDGKRFLAFVNEEPVLYRALSDVYPDWISMSIHRVGIMANWEWGNDTGSTFHNFVAKDRQ